jgi:TonB family protein
MRSVVLLIALSLLPTCPANPTNKTDREHDGFIGPVRTVRIEQSQSVDRSGEWVEDPRVLMQTVVYDSSGRLTERVFYKRDQGMWSRIVYDYDSAGSRSDIIYRALAGQSAQAPGSDQTQGLTEFRRLRRTFKYDSSGNRTEEADYTKEGNLSQRTVYAYDANGFVKEMIEYASDGSVRSRYANKYDERGRISEQRRDDSPGATARKERYAYEFDSTGNWIKRIRTTTYPVAEGKRANEAREIIYRSITYDSSPRAAETGKAIDTSTDITGGTALVLTRPLMIRKSGGVLQASATTRVQPTYPPGAAAQRIAGSVVVEVTLDENGSVIAARALSGPDELRGAAVSAAREWKFHPTALSGVPVEVIGTITFNFNL